MLTKDTATGNAIFKAAAAAGGGIAWSLITANPNPAVKSNGYLCNTTASAFTVTLPAAPSAGDIVSIADGAGTFDLNNLTIGRNSLRIMGLEEDMVISDKNASISFVYASAALGWAPPKFNQTRRSRQAPGTVKVRPYQPVPW